MAKSSKGGNSSFNYMDHLAFADKQIVEPYNLQLRRGDENYLASLLGTPNFQEELMRILFDTAIGTVEVDPEMRALAVEEHGGDACIGFWREMLALHKPAVVVQAATWTAAETARYQTY